MSVTFPRRGDVYWVNLDPTVGSEIAKTRPCVIISNDLGNQFSGRVIVAAITSRGVERAYPFEVVVHPGDGGLTETSKVLLDQIRTVDKQRLRRQIGTLSSTTLAAIGRAVRLSLALDDDRLSRR